MIAWFEYVEVFVALAAGLLALVLGFLGKEPNDLSMGGLALTFLLLIAQLVIAIVAPFAGNHPRGSLLEFWLYQVSVLLLPLLSMSWALLTRTRWSTVVLGVAALAVSVMVYRMGIIWFVQGA